MKAVLVGAVTIVSVFISVSPSLARSCTTTPVAVSAKVRELQSAMMVGALQCRNQPNLNILAHYNQFIANQREVIQTHNGNLRAYFVQASGKAGLGAYDAYVTRLANAQAQNARNAGFCDAMAQMVEAAASVPPAELSQFALTVMPDSATCVTE